MLMPFQVTMVSNYLVLDRLGLMNTVWAIILPGAVSTFPVFLSRLERTGPRLWLNSSAPIKDPESSSHKGTHTRHANAGICSTTGLSIWMWIRCAPERCCWPLWCWP